MNTTTGEHLPPQLPEADEKTQFAQALSEQWKRDIQGYLQEFSTNFGKTVLSEAVKVMKEEMEVVKQEFNSGLGAVRDEVRMATSATIRRDKSPSPDASKPEDYDGDRATGKDWMRTAQLYMELKGEKFSSDLQKIGWTLSFMKSGRAKTFAQEAMEYKEENGGYSWTTWASFLAAFKREFYELEAPVVAFMKLEGKGYHQGKQSVLEYTDQFRQLVRQAGLKEGFTLVSKFRQGLNSEIQKTLGEQLPPLPLDDPQAWYDKARELERGRVLSDAYQQTQSYTRSTPTKQQITASLPNTSTLPAGIPMDVDRSKVRSDLTCWKCKQKGHLSFQCKNKPPVTVRVAELPQEEILQLAQLSLHHLDEDAALMEEDFLQGKM